jgi:predicted RNA-binding Zn-ribbon protein involved in translation (DUF1610 family)
MKHRTWFRLALKAIGILLIGSSIDTVFHFGTILYGLVVHGESWFFSVRYARTSGSLFGDFLRGALNLLQMLSPLLIGLYLVLGGKWLLNMVIPLDRPYCGGCGLDVSRMSGTRCPECGAAIERPEMQRDSGATE